MKTKKLICLFLATVMVISLTACGKSGTETETTKSAKAEHEPITIMSANKDYSGFIEYVKSVYPEINIEIVPYRGANATQYMYDFTGKYNEVRIGQYELDGKIYLLPTDYDIISLVYNASLFEREGWDVPTSFEELEALAPAIKEAGYDLADCATHLPGFGFQYMCNIADTKFLRSIEGLKWQRDFLAGNATAVEGLKSTSDLRGMGKYYGGCRQ